VYPIIYSLRRFRGASATGFLGQPVVIVGVHRGSAAGGEILLRHDDEIRPLRADDRFDYAAIVTDSDGVQTALRSASPASVIDFGPPEGVWEGAIPLGADLQWGGE
jgi:hypothetical protein